MKMIYQEPPGEPPHRTIEDIVHNGLPRDSDEDHEIARLLHDAMRHGQAQSAEVMAEARDRYYNDVKFSAQAKMVAGVLDMEHRLGDEGHRVAKMAAAVALVVAEQHQEERDRELLARHLRALASAENIEDWPGYINDVADGHDAGTSWYRP